MLFKKIFINILGFIYQNAVKHLFFLIEPEFVHEKMLSVGEMMGESKLSNKFRFLLFKVDSPFLKQKISDIVFRNPIGMAAGFDYTASLTQILSSIGFGFETIGTITNKFYEGNPKPMLGRLPKSRSLMVNKGFKNAGADTIIKKLEALNFYFPLGISIGRTNSKNLMTQKESVADVVSGFRKFERSKVDISYYELNISCPNLYGNISFYPPVNLNELLKAVERVKVKKPVFVKMPIEKNEKETLEMLRVISKFKFVEGVIFGNLQKNRKDPGLDPAEVAKFKVGNFSGKPTEKKSNEYISLAYRHFGKRFVIIGCGGVFSAEDAYRKIRLGASLVQLITGLIYQGPQLVSQINYGLIDLLKKDGFKNIKEAVGIDVYKS